MWNDKEVILEKLLGAGGSSVVYTARKDSDE
jgi:hypothetical protein